MLAALPLAALQLPAEPAADAAKESPTYAAKPVIEFKVLLIIKRLSDTWHPLFLPVRSAMTDEDVATAWHCFEIETPEMVRDISQGKVRFSPTVIVSEKPLRFFDPSRRDSAEYLRDELLDELGTLAKPGDYDSVGYYFLHYDTASGYRAPRAGFGVGGYNGEAGIGMFAISCAGRMNPRDEIFLHEWMHGLDGYYGGKPGIRLPKGALHGGKNYDARYSVARAWRPQDTFKGYMEWYRDIFICRVPEVDGFSGYGDAAWKYGPMREGAGRKPGAHFPKKELPKGAYPEWVHAMMKGDLTKAQLAPSELPMAPEAGEIGGTGGSWRKESWSRAPTTTAHYAARDGGVFTLECGKGDHASIVAEAPVTPESNYILTAEVKTNGVKIVEAGGKHSVLISAGDSSVTKDFSGSVGWTRIVLPITSKPDQAKVTLRLQMGGRGSLAQGMAQFRNVKLQRVGYPAAPPARAGAR